MERLIALGDGAACDPAVAGSKASHLALAARAGLPVLPGWVVPVEAGAGALRVGAEAIERFGRTRAVLAVADRALDPELRRDLEVVFGETGARAIVRSSALQESDRRWAGAFSTYADVGVDEVATAVRGCWASAFSRNVLERCEPMGVDPRQLRLAVLIQPWKRFDAGGSARVLNDRRVFVSTAETPDLVMTGRVGGAVAEVGPRPRGGPRDARLPGGDLPWAVAELARATRRATGDDAIEWGAVGDDVVLLQAGRAPAPFRPEAVNPVRRPRSFPPDAERIAEIATRCPAPLGDRLVIPWALAAGLPLEAPGMGLADPAEAFGVACALADELTARAWDTEATLARSMAAETMRSILGPEPERGLARIADLRPVDPASAMRVIGLVAGIGRALAGTRALPAADLVWRLTPEELERAAGGRGAPPVRMGPDRWEPFVAGVVSTNGRTLAGTGVAPGTGAGRLRVLDAAGDGWRPRRREVLVVRDAAPQVAPLLWGAAGLVTSTGSAGAHLFEVARSLGVPAVVGVDVPRQAEGALAAVDGDAGTVSVLETREDPPVEVGA